MFDYALYTLVWFIVSSFHVKRLKCLLNAFLGQFSQFGDRKLAQKIQNPPKKTN